MNGTVDVRLEFEFKENEENPRILLHTVLSYMIAIEYSPMSKVARLHKLSSSKKISFSSFQYKK